MGCFGLSWRGRVRRLRFEVMLSFDEARRQILAGARALGAEHVPLRHAVDRFLADDLLAPRAVPAFDYSAMDGYAASLRSFDAPGPWTLDVRGESKTGSVPEPLESGSAMRIFTGAPMPPGADVVVMQEDVARRGDTISCSEAPRAGQHVRKAGEDLQRGAVALSRGTRLTAGGVGLAAMLDCAHVRVAVRPRVTIICTGDELRAPGDPPEPGTIAESNSFAIAAMAEACGAVAGVAPLARDRREESVRAFRAALASCDLLVTIGGVSVGDYDVVKPALEEAGATIDFWKVKIKPGKPLVWGHAGDARILGLPGNPVSAQITFGLFGNPLLRAMQGANDPLPATRHHELAEPITHSPGREGFYRATMDGDRARPLSGQSSGAATSMAWADCLIRIPADCTSVAAGTPVETIRLSEL